GSPAAVVTSLLYSFLCHDPPTPEIYPLSLHDALPISCGCGRARRPDLGGYARVGARGAHAHPVLAPPGRPAHGPPVPRVPAALRSEEHTSELQSRENLVCRLLLEKKNKHKRAIDATRA